MTKLRERAAINKEPGLAAIPVKHDGLQRRSLLEATWAEVFNFLEMHVVYEPRLDLHQYIPDFLVNGTLIEVKAVWELDDFYVHLRRMFASGWSGPAVVLGIAPIVGNDVFHGIRNTDIYIGVGARSAEHPASCAHLVICEHGRHHDFRFVDYEEPDAACFKCGQPTSPILELPERFKEACNFTQWNSIRER